MIEAQGLTKHYGSVRALEEATFRVGQGEVVGLLGPNGAGKSTTMKILTTFLVPTAGTASVAGHSIHDEPMAVRRATGYLPEVLPLYMGMEVREYLHFVARARGLSGDARRERLGWVVDRCGLAPMLRRPINQLSKGYRQRTALAQALVHDPQVVILDEPTSGLDPHQILEVRDLVRELARSKTVILSTHILNEAQAMSDRIIIINHGRIVGQGTLNELRQQAHETARVYLAVRAPRAEAEGALKEVGDARRIECLEEKKGVTRFALFGADEKALVAKAGTVAARRQWQVLELTAAPYSLEETFLVLARPAAGAAPQGKEVAA